MTLRMGDGPPANLPAGLDAYAGYVNDSGIGETYKEVVVRFPKARHLSITTDGSRGAMCADVEAGAMRSWGAYPYGYADASNIGELILLYGRPEVLWSAHHNNVPHVCTSAKCWPSSPVAWLADGTQWTNHGGAWDESLLMDHFFAPRPSPINLEENMAISAVMAPDGKVRIYAVGAGSRSGQLLEFTRDPANPAFNEVLDITDQIGGADPYTVQP